MVTQPPPLTGRFFQKHFKAFLDPFHFTLPPHNGKFHWLFLETSLRNIESCVNLVTDSDEVTSIHIDGDNDDDDEAGGVFDLDNVGKLLNLSVTEIRTLLIRNTWMTQIQLSTLSNLQHLDLRDNKLSLMSKPSSTIKSLKLSGNPWKCFNPNDPSASSWTYSRFSWD